MKVKKSHRRPVRSQINQQTLKTHKSREEVTSRPPAASLNSKTDQISDNTPHPSSFHNRSSIDILKDRKTQAILPNMQYRTCIPFFTIFGPPNTGRTDLFTKLAYKFAKYTPKSDMVTFNVSSKMFTLYLCRSETVSAMVDVSKCSDLVIFTLNSRYFELEFFEMLGLLKAFGLCKVIVVVKFNNDKKKMFSYIKKRVWKEVCNGISVFDSEDVDRIYKKVRDMKIRPISFKCRNSFVIADKIVENLLESGLQENSTLKVNSLNDDLSPKTLVDCRNKDSNLAKTICEYSVYGFVRGCPFETKTFHIPGIGDINSFKISRVADPCTVDRKLLDKRKCLIYEPEKFSCSKIEPELETESLSSESSDFDIFQGVSSRQINLNPDQNEFEGVKHILKQESSYNNRNLESNTDHVQKNNTILLSDFNNLHDKTQNTLSCLNLLEPINRETSPPVSISPPNLYNENISQNTTNSAKNDIFDSISLLKAKLKPFFEHESQTTQDFIEKFNSKHEETPSLINNTANNTLLVPGTYVEITFRAPKIVFQGLTILGAIRTDNEIVLQGKVKKNNYFCGALRSDEDVFISYGWYRYVSRAVFSIKDVTRNRFLKYIPTGMHCNVSFRGNAVEPGTPFCLIKCDKSEEVSRCNFSNQKEPSSIIKSDKSEEVSRGTYLNQERPLFLIKSGNSKEVSRCIYSKQERSSSIIKCNKLEKSSQDAFINQEGPRSLIKCDGSEEGSRYAFMNRERLSSVIKCDVPQEGSRAVHINQEDVSNNHTDADFSDSSDDEYLKNTNLENANLLQNSQNMDKNSSLYDNPSSECNNFIKGQPSRFRIAAFGQITDISGSPEILKKIKIVGYPYKIYENTAFIKDMFSSEREAIKFEKSLIKTVSGIRGIIKKAMSNGNVRCTFEARVCLSDIVFLKCYVKYEIKREQEVENRRENEDENKRENEDENRRENEDENQSNSHREKEINSFDDSSDNLDHDSNLTPKTARFYEEKKVKKYCYELNRLKANLPLNKQNYKNVSEISLPIHPKTKKIYEMKQEVLKRNKNEPEKKVDLKLQNSDDSAKKQRLIQNIVKSKLEKRLRKNKKRTRKVK